MKNNLMRPICAAAAILMSVMIGQSLGTQRNSKGSSIEQTVDSLFSVTRFSGVAISPDRSMAAWVEDLKLKSGQPSGKSAIFVKSLKSGAAMPRRVTAGAAAVPHVEGDVAWSPDSKKMAFLSDAGGAGQAQLYVVSAGGGAARKLTNVKGFLNAPKWSPDGKSVAILFTENAPRAGGPLQPMTPPSGVIESHIYEQRIATVDAATGRLKRLTPADLYVYEYDWSADGKRLACTAAHGDGDNNWWLAELFTVDAASGDTKSIMKPPSSLQLADPSWSPDGKSIAFIGGIMSDQGSTGGDVYTVSADGGDPVDVTPGMKASASWVQWSRKSNKILFSENVDGDAGFATVDPQSKQIETLWKDGTAMSSGGFGFYPVTASDEHSCALIMESYAKPPEVWAGPIGKWTQVTHANKDQHPNWGEAKSVHWTSDNFNVQGWLVYPRDYDPGRKYPMVVVVHGGPASCSRPTWPGSFFGTTLLSSQGYFVLYPNPRCSYGKGEEFTRANVKDFGYGDLRDILAGVDEVVKTLPVDGNRVGITGWSYGGFMTMWAITQTRRFNAAVSGAGLSDWLSYYGENDIDQWMIPYFGASVYDDPAVYAKSAPINYIKNVKTPTLILVGDSDGECPAPQSFEYWHALKALGVDTQFVVYPGEGHHIYKPNDQRDIMKRMLGWFNGKLK